ncbi:hypothetical protein PHAVU_004G138300, partial [Phaseolus vulgaris]
SDVGGLSLSITGEDCPLDVVVVDGYQGQQLIFVPVNDKKGVIRVSTDFNIYFSTCISCPQSTFPLRNNPGSQTISNWFKIEKYEDAYKMVYCPSVCNYCNYPCSDIGIYQDQYGNPLALTSEPYKVQFQRVQS